MKGSELKEYNYLQKSLLIVTAIAFILCILVTYFSWKSSQNRQAYENTQNELNMAQESLQIEIAENSGGAVQGEYIDVAVETHEQALNMGITSGGVWILVKKS